MLRMYTSSRFSRQASMIFVSSCPPRPTNGIPVLSSSAPGASPKKHSRACGLPIPKTVCVRVLASSLQRVHPATCCCKTSNDNTAEPDFAASGASNNDDGVATFQPVCLGDIEGVGAGVGIVAPTGEG